MTDNEIIKALECCFNNDWNKTKCNKCPFYNGGGGCIDELKKSTLDLINRQQAEIEKEQKIIKAKAIKEFAEMLKRITLPIELAGGRYRYDVITKQGIDHVLKEMVGED